jgi:hypothetical protein
LARNRLASRHKPRRYIVVYFCEQPPDPESRLRLSHERDRLGLNRLSLDWRIPESVHDSLYRRQDLFGQALTAQGLGTRERGTGVPPSDASHDMVRTRMSETPKTGVVDRACRIFGEHDLHPGAAMHVTVPTPRARFRDGL